MTENIYFCKKSGKNKNFQNQSDINHAKSRHNKFSQLRPYKEDYICNGQMSS